MPIVSVGRDKLFEALGKKYSACLTDSLSSEICIWIGPSCIKGNIDCNVSSLGSCWHFLLLLVRIALLAPIRLLIECFCIAADDEFQALCFEYGIELDDVVSLC
jgi:hypothetical protein